MCLAKGHSTAEVGFEPQPLAPESDTLTIRPPCPPLVITDNVILFRKFCLSFMKKGIMKNKGWYIIKTITWIWYVIAYPLPHPLWLIFMNELVLFIFFMTQFFSEPFNRGFLGNRNKKICQNGT